MFEISLVTCRPLFAGCSTALHQRCAHSVPVMLQGSVGSTARRVLLQARIDIGEAAQQKLELQLSELQQHAAKLEESLQDSQSKLKTTQTELASVRAEHAQTKVSIQEGTVLYRKTHAHANEASSPGA